MKKCVIGQLVIQGIICFLLIMDATYGSYAHNVPSNIWSFMGEYSRYFALYVNITSVGVGILGLITTKDDNVAIGLSVVLIASIFLNVFFFLVEIGARF